MTKSKNHWRRLTSTLLFVPFLLAGCGVLLGFLLVALDTAIGERLGYFPRFFGVEPSGASGVLSVVAGSTITIAGTVYSITIVALTLASTQFSPRILRNFMRDTGNQIVLGVLVGIFAYCIIVLRTIRAGGDDGASFVPTVAVVFGVLLGLLGVGFLIYFIHHVAVSIQATSIISAIAEETIAEIKRNEADDLPTAAISAADEKTLAQAKWLKIPSAATGYIQNADASILLNLAEKHDLIVKMRRRVGEFTISGLPLLQIAPRLKTFAPDKKLFSAFNKAFDVNNFRTVEGDVAFGLRQIVDISLKALSPAINDSTTGITCIDYLTAILAELARCPYNQTHVFDAHGNLRLIVNRQKFEDLFDLAFNQIRQSAGGNIGVILRLLTAIEVLSALNKNLSDEAERRARCELFSEQARMLEELAGETIHTEEDLQSVRRVHRRVADLL